MRSRIFMVLFALSLLAAACGPTATAPATPVPLDTPTPLPDSANEPPTATLEPLPTETVAPPLVYGPNDFPAGVNPLTGLSVANPALLERRPIIIKVSNLPRTVRPQWGLSLADIVFEYYTEEGTTRFAAIFLGNDAEQVGSIRSARFFDGNLIRMYKGIFAFGSADFRVRQRLFSADYANRLILEWTAGCPALCRYDPKGYDFLMGNTAALSAYATQQGIPNGRQDLNGMVFASQVPAGGNPATSFHVRYSAAIYNRWDYDPAPGRYLRFSDTADDTTGGQNEVYAQLTDRLTGQPVAADTVVVIFLPHFYYSLTPEIIDMDFTASGPAYVFRDGQVWQVTWQRPTADSVISLANPDGTPFPFKPGVTWFEVMGTTSKVSDTGQGLRFTFSIP